MKSGSGPWIAAAVIALLTLACAGEARAPGEFQASALGGLNEAALAGPAVAWFNVADGQRLFEIRLHPDGDEARHIVMTATFEDWPREGTYRITEDAPTADTFDLLYTVDATRVVRGARGTVEILESEPGVVSGRFTVDGPVIDMASPGAGMPQVRLTGTFRATCTDGAPDTDC